MTGTTINSGVLAACPSPIREEVRMWILQVLNMDPKTIESIEFGGEEDGNAVVTVNKVKQDTGDKDADKLANEPVVRRLTSPLTFDPSEMPDSIDTEAKTLDPDELVDNPTTPQGHDVAKDEHTSPGDTVTVNN